MAAMDAAERPTRQYEGHITNCGMCTAHRDPFSVVRLGGRTAESPAVRRLVVLWHVEDTSPV